MKTTAAIALAVLALAGTALLDAAPARALNPPQTNPQLVAEQLAPSLSSFWSQAVARSNRAYRPAETRWYLEGATVCGLVTTGPNSFYCFDGTIYLDYGWHYELLRGIGDYASGFVYAHEWAHHAQLLTGWLEWATVNRFHAARELQADCYAGVYTRHAYGTKLLNFGDVIEARRWLTANGDDHHWKDGWAHGNQWLRNTWFDYGFSEKSLEGCDLVYQSLYSPPKASDIRPKAKPTKTKASTKKASKKAKKAKKRVARKEPPR